MWENAGNQVVIGFSFGGEFLDQSQSQSSPGLLSIENCSNGITEGDPFFSSCPCAISVIMSSLHVRTRSTERPSRSICPHSLLEGMSLKYLKDAYSSSVIKQPIGTNCLIVVRDNGNSFRGFSVLHCASCTAHKNHVIRQISARLLQEHGIIS